MAFRRISYVYTPQEWALAIDGIGFPIAQAATLAMRRVAGDARDLVRSAAAGAGFSRRFQNALRQETYPRRGQISLEPAGLIYSKIQYAGVFAEGATISGSPLWVPMSHAPKKIGRFRFTADNLATELGRGSLVVVTNRAGKRFLAARVGLTERQKRVPSRISLASLRRGAAGGRGRLVPLFVERRSVTISKKFDVPSAAATAFRNFPRYYQQLLRPDLRRNR